MGLKNIDKKAFVTEIRSYLNSLSHNELLELCFSIIENNESAKDIVFQKINEEQNREKKPEIFNPKENEIYVNRSSSSQEKIALFKSLFAGRTDVFSLRWHNQKTNKSGYSPVCSNKWQSGKCDLKKRTCASCPYKSPVPLSDSYIFAHLCGKDEFARDVIGLYPLFQDNTCRFLAFDFDSHKNIETDSENQKWKSDVVAVYKVCKDFMIPCSIEISRSGSGAHLWIFFSENIKAKTARNFGNLILMATMKEHHSLSFESFDRMFPNQDEIPNGGYGNLIALPLQGKAVKENHSVFVDENFISYQDQWKYLSSVQKLNSSEIKKISSKISESIPNFFAFNKNEEECDDKKISLNQKFAVSKDLNFTTFSDDDFKSAVQITLSNFVEIKKDGISERALGELKRTAVFLNPEYFKNLRMRLPLYNIPRYIDCSQENKDSLLLPRGNLKQILQMFEEQKIDYYIEDKRESGQKIDVEFASELFDEQRIALDAMQKSDIGILCAGTGFGKTVTAAALIAKRKTNTLILVQTHSLLEQWKRAIKQFLNFTAGTISAGKDKSTGIIDIALARSLIEPKTDVVKKWAHKYGMIIVDECHHVSAFSFENLLKSFYAKYVYGLTATPVRRDGHQKIIFYQCGPILYSTSQKQMNGLQNFSRFFIPRFTNFHIIQSKEKNYSINQFYEELVQDEARNNLIVSDVKKCVEEGKTPLVLSDRIEHLENFAEKLKDAAKNVILITGKGTHKQKSAQLEKLKSVSDDESLIVLATGKYVGEGFDFPRFDTLILSMPFSWKGILSQYCGRLHRNFQGKTEVQIYDYVDFRLPVFDRMYQKRLKGYKHLGYKIKNFSDKAQTLNDSENAKIFSKDDYKSNFESDLFCAKNIIVISSPYLSKKETNQFILTSANVISNGIRIFIIKKLLSDESKSKAQDELIKSLENAGIQVVIKENLSQKIAVIDKKVLWYGSVNFLGFSEQDDCCMRISSAQIASEVEAEIIKKN